MFVTQLVLFLLYVSALVVRFMVFIFIFFFKQKTAYEMRISDWSSDVCSSDLVQRERATALGVVDQVFDDAAAAVRDADLVVLAVPVLHTAEALRSCVGALKAGAIVSDVGSTKQIGRAHV